MTKSLVKMADQNKGVPQNVNNPEEDINASRENMDEIGVQGPSDDFVFDGLCKVSGSSESESDDFSTPTKDFNLLNVPEYRPRSNSEVERPVVASLEFDVVLANRPQTSQCNRLPLITPHEHDRGNYMLPSVDPNIYPPDEYKKPSNEPGEVFIFNFETYRNSNSSPRDGTRLDVRALIETLGLLKFNIPHQRIYNDLTKDQVMNTIATATATFDTDQPKKQINCLIVVFMTHGLANNIIEAHDDVMKVDDIIHAFSACDALDGVPKWFTFLACKERKYNLQPSGPKKVVSDQTYIKRLPDDVILYYSTTEDNKSARVKEEGTWVIQELCKALDRYGRRDEIFAILTRANKAIANNYVGGTDDFRQCPVILSTLTQKFYLTVSKDRKAQLEILKRVQKLQEIANNLKK